MILNCSLKEKKNSKNNDFLCDGRRSIFGFWTGCDFLHFSDFFSFFYIKQLMRKW